MSTNTPHRTDETLLSKNSSFYKEFQMGNRPVINAAEGGMYGFAPNNFRYVSEQPYLSQRPYCVVLSTPQAFSHVKSGDVLHGLLRSFMETRSREWSGASSRTTTEYVDISWAGGSTLSFPSGSTRQFGTLSHMAIDPEGEAFSKLITFWQEYLLSDPVIRHPKIITLGYPGDLLLDEISMSSIYFEPTRNFTDVAHACLSLAQMPVDGPQYEMGYNVEETSGKTREISVEFKGLFEYDTFAAKEIARTVMKRMALYNPNGRRAPEGFNDVTATLKAIKNTNGVTNLMSKEAKSLITNEYIG